MNPLDFLNQAINSIIAPRGPVSSEDDLRVRYVEALTNPAGFVDDVRGVVDALNQRSRRQDEEIRKILNK